MIDFQVMVKRNTEFMGHKNKSIAKAIVYDKPSIKIEYVAQIFQKDRNAFGDDYILPIHIDENISLSQNIPYDKMKTPNCLYFTGQPYQQ